MTSCLSPSCLVLGDTQTPSPEPSHIPVTALCSPCCEPSQAIKGRCCQWCCSGCQGAPRLWITKSTGTSAQTHNRMVGFTKLSKLWQWLGELTRPCLCLSSAPSTDIYSLFPGAAGDLASCMKAMDKGKCSTELRYWLTPTTEANQKWKMLYWSIGWCKGQELRWEEDDFYCQAVWFVSEEGIQHPLLWDMFFFTMCSFSLGHSFLETDSIKKIIGFQSMKRK